MKIITLILLLVMLPVVAGQLDLCQDTREIYQNCTMLTPQLFCNNFNYTVTNISGTIVQSGNLTDLRGDIYQFNLTVTEGDYIIELCDGTTREVRVKEDEDNMIIAAIIMAPLFLGIMFILVAWSLGDEHKALKFFLSQFSIISFFVSMGFGLMAVARFYNWPELQEMIGTNIYWFSLVFLAIMFYWFAYLLWKIFNMAAQRKKERLQY